MGDAAAKGTKDSLQIKSPSRVYYEIGMSAAHRLQMLRYQRHLLQLLQRNQTGAQSVIHIMVVIGNFIGQICNLRFQ